MMKTKWGHMDGRKWSLFFFSLLFVIACDQKKDVTDEGGISSQKLNCSAESFVKTRFIVTYEDGRVEIIHAENEELLQKDFIEPRLKEIKRVEYDSRVEISGFNLFSEDQVGTYANENWGSEVIQANQAWNQGIYGQDVKVAVIDAAVDITHPQISPRLSKNLAEYNGGSGLDDDGNGYKDDIYGWDFYRRAPNAAVKPPVGDASPNVHGSHVAGIILADHTTGNVPGVAPQANLIPINFMDDNGGGDISAAISAIQYATSRGAKVINASWGGSGCNPSLADAITNAGRQGVLFVTAAGNDGYDYDRLGSSYYRYPAVFNLDSQITVGASTLSPVSGLEILANFSNKSYSLVHIGAPGEYIRSTVPTFASSSGSAYLDGTSMAAPFVSGVAALLWSAKPNATVAQIKQALLSSVDSKSFKVSTRGRVNVPKALAEIRRIVP